MLKCFKRMTAGSGLRLSSFLLSVLLLFLLSAPAQGDCVDETLDSIEADTLLMDSQEIYRLLDDPQRIIFWLPLSRVTICDQLGDVDDEIAVYYEIRNQDSNQMVRAMRER